MSTKAPWKVESGAVFTEQGTPIASMDRKAGNGTLPVERDEYARLIAAAPELLKAAELAVQWIDEWVPAPSDPNIKTMMDEAVGQLESAIAKASS